MAILTAILFVTKVSHYMAAYINKRFWASKKKLKRLEKLEMKKGTKNDIDVCWELGLVNSTIQMISKNKTKISAFEKRIVNKAISKTRKNWRRWSVSY